MTLWVEIQYGKSQPDKSGGHRYCSNEDMFLLVEEQDSTCSCLNSPLLFHSKAHGTLRSHIQNFTRKKTLTKSVVIVCT